MTRARGQRRLRSFAVALVSALVCTGAAWGADVGANDDTGKYEPDAGAAFYDQMARSVCGRRCAGSRAIPSRSASGRSWI